MVDRVSRLKDKCEDKFGQCECYGEVRVGQTNLVPKESTDVYCQAKLTD
jgi:hypothetical protein